MDRQAALLLPPVYRPYRQFFTLKNASTPISTGQDQNLNLGQAYHVGCFSDDA